MFICKSSSIFSNGCSFDTATIFISFGLRFIFLHIFNILFFITFKFLSIFLCMVKLVSNRLNESLSKVYNLSRKNKNETILIWIFLDSDRINCYKKFINLIPSSRNIGIIFRSKNIVKQYYHAKELLKLCRKKKFTFFSFF